MSDDLSGTAYFQLRKSGLRDCDVVAVTQKPPQRARTGCVVVKVRVTIPAAAFKPLEAAAEVAITSDMALPMVEPVSPQVTDE